MRHKAVAAILAAVVGLAGCGGDGSAATTAPPGTATTAPAVTTGPPTTPTAVAPGTIEPLAVAAGGETWQVPAGICSGDPAEQAAAVDAAAAEVERIVAGRVSGWPTTTAPPPGEDRFPDEVRPAGVVAVAVAEAAGLGAALVDRWAAYEAGYADPAQGWGGITEISMLSPEWRGPAAALAAAIPEACAAR